MSEAPQTVRVWFASNRQFADPEGDGLDPVATSRRAQTLSLGLAEVKIPAGHKRGVIETVPPLALNAAAYPKFELGRVHLSTCSPKPHLIHTSHELIQQSFRDLVEQHQEDWRQRCCVFVHGYNESFEHALFTAAQMQVDLPYAGSMLVFSWPSAGTYQGYTYDQESLQISRQYLLQFFEALLLLGVTDISLLTHSLGARLVLETLSLLKLKVAAGMWHQQDHTGVLIKDVVFCHPDVSVMEYRLQMRTICDPHHAAVAERFSLIVNQTDKALGVSAPFHGSEELRLGAGNAGFGITSADLIDVSSLHLASMDWGHNLYRDNEAGLAVLNCLLNHGELASCERLKQVGNRAWQAS